MYGPQRNNPCLTIYRNVDIAHEEVSCVVFGTSLLKAEDDLGLGYYNKCMVLKCLHSFNTTFNLSVRLLVFFKVFCILFLSESNE